MLAKFGDRLVVRAEAPEEDVGGVVRTALLLGTKAEPRSKRAIGNIELDRRLERPSNGLEVFVERDTLIERTWVPVEHEPLTELRKEELLRDLVRNEIPLIEELRYPERIAVVDGTPEQGTDGNMRHPQRVRQE